MDREHSFERRYSFNASLKNPAAESTKLNHSNANRSGLGSTSFKWGSSPISPKQRSNSSANLINFDSTIANESLNRSRCRTIRKIDPRIVADVQSKGLASRIVKYHENGNRLNRSMSAHNLCTKPGQFPVVTLKKTDLPYRATKQNVSMTRIAPPEKSVFYGNTLSSLLRSNSVVGLHKSDEDISRENRPILHPPPTENDMAPTRSVLDVLKEISRKRINSDDPDVNEASKKNRIANDTVDTGAQTIMTQSFKRQRDINSPHNGDALSATIYQESRFSPEQAKKRVCSYNNDITSSLSSSVKHRPLVNKRPSYQLNQTMPTRLESYETQKNKTPRIDGHTTSTDIRLDSLENNTSRVSQNVDTTTVTDGSTHGTIPSRSKSDPTPFENRRSVAPENKPRLTLFNKVYDVESASCETEEEEKLDESGECAGIQFVKPKKLSSSGLKNPIIERAQKSKLALMLSGLRGELYNESENDELDAAPQTIQDNKKVSETKSVEEAKEESLNKVPTTTAMALQTTTTTISNSIAPIASMKLPEKPAATNNNSSFAIKHPSSSSSPLVGIKLTPPTTTAANDSTAQKPAVTQNLSTPVLQGFAPNSTISTPKTTGVLGTTASFGTNAQPSFSFKPVADSNTAKISEVAKSLATTTQSSSISFDNLTKTSAAPAALPAPTFSFGANNKATTTSVPTTSLTSSVATATSGVTVPTLSVATTATTMFSNTFSFGTTTATTSAPSQNATVTPHPVTTSAPSSTFSFGTNINAPSSTAAAAKPSASFSFGNTTTAPAQLSFGGASTPSNNLPAAGSTFSFGTSSNEKSTMFSAGNPNAAPATVSATTEAPKPSFGLSTTTIAPVFGTATTSAATNAFNSSNSSAQPNLFGSANPQPQTLFGSSTAPKPTFGSDVNKPTASVPAFGSSSSSPLTFGQPPTNNTTALPNKPATSGFSFGSATTAPQASVAFTFGGAASGPSNAIGNNAPAARAAPLNNTLYGSGANGSEKNNSTSIFGGSNSATQINNSSGGFPFGSAANTPAAPKPATGGFSFGSAANTPAATKPAEPATGGFSFGAGSNASATQKPQSAFTFGSSNTSSSGGNTSVTSPTGGFSFGAPTQQKSNDAAAKPFSFGPSSSTNNQASAPGISGSTPASNMFATNMMNKPAAPAFNFGAAPQTMPQSAAAAPAATNNIFAPPAVMAAGPGSGDRPIRRATRRLQK